MRLVGCTVDEQLEGAPLWHVLEERLCATRACIRRARDRGDGILLDGVPARTTTTVHAGQTVSMDVSDRPEDADSSRTRPEPGPVDVVYEDEDLIVVNKQPGLPVHPCPGHRSATLGNFVLQHFADTNSDCVRLYPAHRLDWGTSGLIVFAKHGYAHTRLQAFMDASGHGSEHGTFERTYLALCEGTFDSASGTVDAPIARVRPDAIERAVDPRGQRAITHYRVLCEVPTPDGGARTAVELRLETGRTHQIRVHMAHVGHPLTGDPLYGSPSSVIDRPALHSWRLLLTQPVSGATLELEAPVAPDMAELLRAPDGSCIPEELR